MQHMILGKHTTSVPYEINKGHVSGGIRDKSTTLSFWEALRRCSFRKGDGTHTTPWDFTMQKIGIFF